MATRTSVCKFDSKHFRKDARTGYLYAKVNPTKAGVFLYRDSETGEIVRELRSRREVHKADSLKSLENKPFTDDHPPELLTSATVKQHQTGMVIGQHKVAQDGIHTEAEVVVMDGDHIAKIDAGKEAVSCGYECDIIDKPGVDPEFGPHDREQVNIKYDHLANVHRGRAGEGAKLRADSGQSVSRFDAEEVEAEDSPENRNDHKPPKEQSRYMIHRLDGHDVDMSEAAIEAYKAEQVKKDNAIRTEKERADKAEKAFESQETLNQQLKAKVDAAEKIDVEALVKAGVKARSALERQAEKVGVKADKFDSMSDRDLKVAIITSKLDFTAADLKEKQDAYIDTLLDVADKAKSGRNRTALDSYDDAEDTSRETLDGFDLDKDPMDD